MAAHQLLVVCLLFCIVQRTTGQITADITMDPETVELAPAVATEGGRVAIMCKVQGASTTLFKKFYTLTILRKLDGSNQERMVTFDLDDGSLNPPNAVSGRSVNSSKEQRFLELTMTQTKCADGGVYTCEVVYQGQDSVVRTITSDKRLQVEVTPGPINMTPEPKGITQWLVNNTLQMRCNGAVGTVNGNATKIEWIWEYRYERAPPVLPGNWLLNDNPSDITEGQTFKETCYELRSSTLKRTLAVIDTDRVYRCYIKRNNIPFTQYAANLTVGSVTEEPVTTPAPSGSGNSASKADLGPILGGILGALVVVVVIIVIIIVVVRRRRSSSEESSVENKPSEVSSSFPPNSSEVTYSQPNRFRNNREPQGVTNKAMDEKPSPREYRPAYEPEDRAHQPPRYANDFHQGHRNQAYDSNPDPHGRGNRHYSSDEDGTDLRQGVNTSQLSIGHGDPSIGTAI